MRHILAVAGMAVAIAISACGAPVEHMPRPATSHDLYITEQDHTATMKVGQIVVLVLHANPGMTNWAGVRSSDPSVLAPIADTAGTAIAVRGVTVARFLAVTAGQVEITASAGALCSPGQACPQYAVLLSIRVTVAS